MGLREGPGECHGETEGELATALEALIRGLEEINHQLAVVESRLRDILAPAQRDDTGGGHEAGAFFSVDETLAAASSFTSG